MSTYPWQNVKFLFLLDYLLEVNSGQAGRSNSLWFLSYCRIADFCRVKCSVQWRGYTVLSAVLRLCHLFLVSRVACTCIDHPLEITTGQGSRGCRSILLDSYGRLHVADLVVFELTAEENDYSTIELLKSI